MQNHADSTSAQNHLHASHSHIQQHPTHSASASASTSTSDPAPTLTSLDPSHYRQLFQNQLKAIRDAHPSHKIQQAQSLLQSFLQASQLASLHPHEWHLCLALQIHLASLSSSQRTALGPATLHHIFELHRQSTLQYQSPALFQSYISLVLAYFSRLSAIHLPLLSPGQDDAETSSHQPFGQVQDPVLEWTGIESCPRIYSHSGTYDVTSLPDLLGIEEQDGVTWEHICSLEAVRGRIREAYTRFAYQLQESQSIWTCYLEFELAILRSGKLPKEAQTETVRQVFLARLKVPHAAIDHTFQRFSTFVTEHLPPQQYESEMSSANAIFSQSKSTYQLREQFEDALSTLPLRQIHAVGSTQDLQTFATHCKRYLGWQVNRAHRTLRSKDRSAAQTELDLTSSLFERLIPCFGLHPPSSTKDEIYCYLQSRPELERHAKLWKRLPKEHKDAQTQDEQQRYTQRLALAEGLWIDYISILSSGSRPDASLAMDVCARSVRVLPTSIALHCTLMRQVARFRRPKSQIEEHFERVCAPGALRIQASELVDLCLARIDCERDLAAHDIAINTGSALEVDPATDMEKFMDIYALCSYALDKLGGLDQQDRDPSLRLERCTVSWVERAVQSLGGPNSEGGAGLNELAESVWQTASTQQAENPLVYRQAAAYWTRRFDSKKARAWFKAGLSKLEKNYHARTSGEQDPNEYQAFLQDWLQFEHQFGSVQEIEHVLHKVRTERERALEAWYASYNYYQQQSQQQQPPQQAAISEVNGNTDEAMKEDTFDNVSSDQANGATTGKRKASEEEEAAIAADVSMGDRNAPHSGHEARASLQAEEDHKRTRVQDSAEKAPSRDREHCSVLVTHLPLDMDASGLRSFLRGCGRIVEITGPTSLSAQEGGEEVAALVEFSDASGASSALTRHGKSLDASMVSISIGWKCTLFVTNFPETFEDPDIRDLFQPYGTIFSVRWPSKRFSSSRRFCYVQFTTPSAAQSALALNESEVAPDRKLNVALSDPARKKTRSDTFNNSREVFVSGFPRNISDQDLRGHFEGFGPVTGVRLLRTPDGRLRGIGFVDFDKVLDAQKAIQELNGTKFRGKTISVSTVDSNKSTSARSNRSTTKTPEPGSAPSTIQSAAEDRKSRSVKVFGLPADAQEALIQQSLEHLLGRGSVKQVFWKQSSKSESNHSASATIEFHDQANAGKAVLRQSEITYSGHPLRIVALEEFAPSTSTSSSVVDGTSSAATITAFVPRASRGISSRGRARGRAVAAVSRARPGLSSAALPTTNVEDAKPNESGPAAPMEMELETPAPADAQAKRSDAQDKFRAMLNRSST